MSVQKKEYYGKEVTDAIRSACESLKVPQEKLDIEVLETGSTGIFGLIRKKAKIRVSIKQEGELKTEPEMPVAAVEEPVQAAAAPVVPIAAPAAAPAAATRVETPAKRAEESELDSQAGDGDDEDEDDEEQAGEGENDASEDDLQIVREEVTRLVELMGFPSNVAVSAKGLAVSCSIRGESEEELAGPEGKTLDAIQYLIRKIVARRCSERLRITINVGDFRERRLEELKVRAVELARMVRESGKTQVLPALNPSERREIHMVLQEDKEVRSRSVGDGLFKKILIYKPGKGNRGGRRKSSPRNRRGKGEKNTSGSSEE